MRESNAYKRFRVDGYRYDPSLLIKNMKLNNDNKLLLTCTNYFNNDLENPFEFSEQGKKEIIISAYLFVDDWIKNAGYLTGVSYPEFNLTELEIIEVFSKDYARLGIGSTLLKTMEEASLNHNCHHIKGTFAPFNKTVANTDNVRNFYLKNGYSFCKTPFITNCLYKNFDKNGVAKKPIENFEETDEFLYYI